MEFENEKKNEEMSAEQQSTNNSQDGGYQGYRPGRSPRPRIHQTVRPYNQGGYHQNQNQEEGGFRPEGFGAGLQGGTPQRAYRPRNNYNQEGGYQPRQQGYRPRPQYGQQEGGYQPRQQGYRPRPQYGQQEGGYQPRQQEGGYQPRQQGYRPRPQYGQQEGGYQPRGGYQSRQGGYQSRQQGYNPNYGGKPYGAPYGNPYKKKQHGPYDPNAKYSMKKRIEYKEEHGVLPEAFRTVMPTELIVRKST